MKSIIIKMLNLFLAKKLRYVLTALHSLFKEAPVAIIFLLFVIIGISFAGGIYLGINLFCSKSTNILSDNKNSLNNNGNTNNNYNVGSNITGNTIINPHGPAITATPLCPASCYESDLNQSH